MRPSPRLFRLLPLPLLVAACGGAPPPAATSAEEHEAALNRAAAEAAAAQGGIGALGSASNAGGNAGSTTATHLKGDLLADGERVKLDGVLGEWPARTKADDVVSGTPDAGQTFNVGVRYDANAIYVGGEVTTANFHRTSRFANDEDHASLILAFGAGTPSAATYEVGFFAGKPGESSGQVRFLGGGRGSVAGAKIVEAPMAGGYSFEASVPWSAFPEARTTRIGLRASARYVTKGAEGLRIVATGPGDARHPELLAPLPLESEQALDEGFLGDHGLRGHAPDFDLLADVAGDAMKERVTVWGNRLTICGPGYRGGKDYFFRDLGGPVVRLEARPLTGRGKDDLIVVRRVSEGDLKRDWYEVLSFLGKDDPDRTFAQEVAVTRGDQHVEDAVRVANGEIDVTVGAARGWDGGSYHELLAGDALPVLLPWGPVRSETFRFDGTAFKKTHETTQPSALGTHQTRPGSTELPREPPRTLTVESAPAAPAGALLEQFKRDNGVPANAEARFDLSADLDGDHQAERISLVDRHLVVTGPSLGGGHAYTFLTLQPFTTASDIHEVTARDLAGRGSSFVVVRGTRHVHASAGGSEGDADATDEDVLYVYALKNGALGRVFGIETARAHGANRVQGLVQFIPAKRGSGFDIDVRPGRATGWTSASYPWPQDRPGTGSIEPLLLPWGSIPNVRYEWDGTRFTSASR